MTRITCMDGRVLSPVEFKALALELNPRGDTCKATSGGDPCALLAEHVLIGSWHASAPHWTPEDGTQGGAVWTVSLDQFREFIAQ